MCPAIPDSRHAVARRAASLAVLLAIACGLRGSPASATSLPPDQGREGGVSSQSLAVTSLALGCAGIAVGVMPPASASSRTLRGATSLALGAIGLSVLGASRTSRYGAQNDVLSYVAALTDVSAVILGVSMWRRELRPRAISATIAPFPPGGFGVVLLARF